MTATGKRVECPGCGGPLEFDPVSQKMKCSYCGNEIKVEEMDRKQEKTGNKSDFRGVTCENCGAELLTDEFTTATFCSYCGSAAIVESRITGERTPDYVIPFKVDKEKAIDLYKGAISSNLFVPDVFKSAAVLDKITGIYVPFWLFDYGALLHADGECVRLRFSADSEYRYTHRDYFYVCRDIEAKFEKVPADASEKMEDGLMDKLEPFDYQDLEPFTMEYLSGFLSERYNMKSDALRDRVESRVDQYMEEILTQEIAGYTEKNIRQNISHHLSKVHYVLLPVWLLNYHYKDKDYTFTVNGQTGKVVADPPIGASKVAAVFAFCFALLFVFVLLMWEAF